MTETPRSAPTDAPDDDNRRMAPVYIAVLVVEAVTLLALWWFQNAFGR